MQVTSYVVVYKFWVFALEEFDKLDLNFGTSFDKFNVTSTNCEVITNMRNIALVS